MKLITNPSGAFGDTNVEGNNFQIVADFQVVGSVDVAAHDAVSLVWDETARTVKCEPWDTDASGQGNTRGHGVALDAGTAGDFVRVVLFGFALVNIGSGNSCAEGEYAIGSTTKGVVTSRAIGAAGTNTSGTLGVFLGDEDGTSDTGPLWVYPAILIDTTA